VTFLRVVVRNAASDRYKNQLTRIRQQFLKGENDPRIGFLSFHPYEKTRRTPRDSWWRFRKGGWAETMALVEALLAGGLVTFAWWPLGGTSIGKLIIATALGVVAGCLMWRRLLQRADDLYNEELKEDRDGSVPLRGRGGRLVVPRQ
jgi:hypothetical protein